MDEKKLKKLLYDAFDAGVAFERFDRERISDEPLVDNFEMWYTKQKLNIHGVMQGLPNVTRVEVIDEKGRSYVNWNRSNRTEIDIQDEGRTLKVFISRSPTVGREREETQE